MSTATPRAVKSRTPRSNSTQNRVAAEPLVSPEQIAQRAYEKFLARGCVHGFDQQDWFDAQDELIAESRDRR